MKDLIEKHLKCVDTMMTGDAMFSDEILEIVRKYTTNWTAALEEADNLCKETCSVCKGKFSQHKAIVSEAGDVYCIPCFDKAIVHCHICENQFKLSDTVQFREQATCETCYDTYMDGVKDEALESVAILKRTLENEHGCFKARDIYEHIIDHAVMVRES